jgi:hypothetical protein
MSAPPLDVKAHIEAPDGGVIGVGTPFRLIIEAKHAEPGIALLPESLPFDAAKLGERVPARKHARVEEDGVLVDRYTLELLAFESGEFDIPPIPLALGSTNATSQAIALSVASGFSEEELPIANATVAEAMPELEKMAAVDPQPVPVTFTDHTLLYVGSGVLLAMVIAFVTWRLLRDRRAEVVAPAPPPPPPRPAHEVAFEKLEALRRAGYLERGEKKTFFVELSAIMREYAGARWGFDSLELTIDELMIELSKHNTAGLDVEKLSRVLDRADLVKFAKFDPEVQEATAALSDASEIVERSKRVEAPR